MPDQSSAADEHALLQEITAPLATLPDDAVHVAAQSDFPIAFRGYDRLAVDAYVKKTSQLVAELQSTRSPEAAVRRALERVGEQISGILQRAHETAEQITTQSRREAEGRLVVARRESAQIVTSGEQRVKDLDAETDRIWAERLRIVEDARELAAQLLALADEAAARFPPAEDTTGEAGPERPSTALFDAEVVEEDELDNSESEPTSTEGDAERRGEERERPVSVPPPPGGAHPPPPPVSGPPPPAADAPNAPNAPPTPDAPDAPPSPDAQEAQDAPEVQPEPEPEADDPEATAILQPNRGRHGEPSGGNDEPPPTVRMPMSAEPPPAAEHPSRPPSQSPPKPPPDPPQPPPDPPLWSR